MDKKSLTRMDSKEDRPILEREKLYPVSKFNKKTGIIIASLLSRTKISPNMVTLVRLFMGFLVALLLSFGSYSCNLIGAGLIQLYWTLDFTDGHLAKLKGISSSFGSWFDIIVDRIVLMGIFIGVTIGVYSGYKSELIWIVGFFVLFGCYVNSYAARISVKFFAKRNALEIIPRDKTNWLAWGYRRLRKIKKFLSMCDVQFGIITIGAIFDISLFVLVFFCVFYNISWLGQVGKRYREYLRTK